MLAQQVRIPPHLHPPDTTTHLPSSSSACVLSAHTRRWRSSPSRQTACQTQVAVTSTPNVLAFLVQQHKLLRECCSKVPAAEGGWLCSCRRRGALPRHRGGRTRVINLPEPRQQQPHRRGSARAAARRRWQQVYAAVRAL
jgi:hypothetical protein